MNTTLRIFLVVISRYHGLVGVSCLVMLTRKKKVGRTLPLVIHRLALILLLIARTLATMRIFNAVETIPITLPSVVLQLRLHRLSYPRLHILKIPLMIQPFFLMPVLTWHPGSRHLNLKPA